MPKLEPGSPSPSSRRKSSRAKRQVNNSLLNDLPADVVSSLGGDKDDRRMPPGYNVSDDSEDEFKPSAASKVGKRKDESDIDSEEENVSKKNKKQRRRGPGRKSLNSNSAIVTTPNLNTVSSSMKKMTDPAPSGNEVLTIQEKFTGTKIKP